MRVLVVNAGSSSLKLSVLDGERTVGEQDAVSELLEAAGPVDAVGHRVVHGGPDRAGAALLNDGRVDALAALTPLAPLHQPRAVAGIRSLRELLPDLPAVACFDTAFHHGLPAAARTYALPREWNARWRLRRFGFHGLSHAYAVRRAAHLVHRDLPGLRVLSCHLGAGASLCGVAGGASVDTTMGFTPMEGLVMRTRSGSVDPGLLLWLQEHGGVDAGELADTLNHRSGLAGLSGTSGDLRDVLAARHVRRRRGAAGVRRVRAPAGPRGGGDDGGHRWTGPAGADRRPRRALGAAAPRPRRRLAHLGVQVDDGRNARVDGDADISAAGAAVRTVVVVSREDLQVAAEVRALLAGSATDDQDRARRVLRDVGAG